VIAGQDSLYATAALDKTTNELIVKLVNASGNAQQKEIKIDGVKGLHGTGRMTVLKSEALERVNHLKMPRR
jgi:alpha-L-arabinofuranosidase